MIEKVVTLVLGGGQGTRLYPLTSYRSKPAVPIGGKYRLVDIPISNSINSGLNQIFVLTQFNSTSLHRHIHRTYPYGIFTQTSVELLAAEQTHATADWFQGPADAVRKHFSHYPSKDVRDFLILSGDHLYQMDYQHILKFHRDKNADITVATIPVAKREVSGFGIMKLRPSGRINAFKEKPSPKEKIADFIIPDSIRKTFDVKGNKELYLASMGIYVFKQSVLKKVLEGQDADFGKEVIPKSIKTHKVLGYVYNGYWRDIGTIRSFYEANLELTKSNPRFKFSSDEGTIYTRARFLPPSKINGTQLKDTLVGEGCNLDDVKIEDSIIGLRSTVRKGSVVKKSIIMGNDYYEHSKPRGKPYLGIGKNCQIKNAILDKNTRIGNKVVIANQKRIKTFDAPNYFIREGIVIIPKGAAIADGTVI